MNDMEVIKPKDTDTGPIGSDKTPEERGGAKPLDQQGVKQGPYSPKKQSQTDKAGVRSW
jgi:hypothetical protein